MRKLLDGMRASTDLVLTILQAAYQFDSWDYNACPCVPDATENEEVTGPALLCLQGYPRWIIAVVVFHLPHLPPTFRTSKPRIPLNSWDEPYLTAELPASVGRHTLAVGGAVFVHFASMRQRNSSSPINESTYLPRYKALHSELDLNLGTPGSS